MGFLSERIGGSRVFVTNDITRAHSRSRRAGRADETGWRD
jgi:hypothetical protein